MKMSYSRGTPIDNKSVALVVANGDGTVVGTGVEEGEGEMKISIIDSENEKLKSLIRAQKKEVCYILLLLPIK